ncbi:MAG: SurA N-terminal domain-containing protein [Eggerthellaceae bacterium]|nr:SurA N-terminal domain-containing protein [Eggerthellaceae bacterium]
MAGENDERLTTDADVKASEQAVEESDAKLETLEEQAGQADAEKAAQVEQEAPIPAEPEANTKSGAAEEAPVPAKVEAPAADDTDPEDKPEGIGNIIAIAVIALIFGLLLCLPATMGSAGSASGKAGYDTSGGVAATFNGVEIGENDVTDFVVNFRKSQGLEDEAAWGEWMVSYGYTPESLRNDTVNYFVQKEMLVQAAKENDIEVGEKDVEDRFAEYVAQAGGEEALKGYLEQNGLSLESYKENIRYGLLQEALADKVVTDAEKADDETVLQVLKIYYSDQVPADATSLDGIDESLVTQVRNLIGDSLKQEAFSKWLADYEAKADIVVNDMPKGLPYDIDLESYQGPEDNLMSSEDELALDEGDDANLVIDEEGDADLGSDAASEKSSSK